MSDYVPGTDEQDPKKVIMALQLAAENISTAQDAIDTNTSDIAAVESDVAANTAAIAANDAAISALQTAVTNASFASGTRVLFQQTNAPTGWTKETAHNDKVLRVVSGTASAGGANSFSTVMAQTVVGSTALTLAQIPAHTHTYSIGSNNGTVQDSNLQNAAAWNQNTSTNTGSAGSGDAHNHSITMNMAYVDIIIGVKD
jgi:hypothetical protein